ESEFSKLILLKKPIVEEASWEFETSDSQGQKHVVTGRIITIGEENETIDVEYTTAAGHLEKRTLKKNQGTVSFVKQVAYKDAVTYTGYHSIQNEAVTEAMDEDDKYDALEGIEIDNELYQLID